MEEQDRKLIDAAVAQGILSPEQHRRMAALADGKPLATPDERFRIVHGFSEVFISIGLMMLLSALGGLLQIGTGSPASGLILTAGTAWFLAYFFTTKKRALLPAILCCLYASYDVGQALFYLWMDQPAVPLYQLKMENLSLVQLEIPFIGAFLVLLASILRFRIPFLMLPLGILFTVMVTLGVKFGGNPVSYRIVLGLCGLSLLGVSLFLDLKDPERIQRTSDFAFWGYVVGSPLTVHPLFISLFMGTMDRKEPILIVLIMILVAGIISFGALLINRRAFILSTLIYITISLGYLFNKLLLVNTGTAILLTTLIVGLYVVALGTCWIKARRYLMTHLTPRPWFSKLPPF